MEGTYDYIGEGGFLIQCVRPSWPVSSVDAAGDEHEQDTTMQTDAAPGPWFLGIHAVQAERLAKACPYFHSCFQHGTIESQRRILEKPNWSIGVARHVIELADNGRTTVPHISLTHQVWQAADETCLSFGLSNLVDYASVIPQDCMKAFWELVDDSSLVAFDVTTALTPDQWVTLLRHEVLLHRSDTNYVLRLADDSSNENKNDDTNDVLLHQLHWKASTYRVHAKEMIRAAMVLEHVLCISPSKVPSTGTPLPTRQRLSTIPQASLYLETTTATPPADQSLSDPPGDFLNRLGSGTALVRTCSDNRNHSLQGYTIKGSFDLLLRAIHVLGPCVDCEFRLEGPCPDTLARFFHALSSSSSSSSNPSPVVVVLEGTSPTWFVRYRYRPPSMDVARQFLTQLRDGHPSSRVPRPTGIHIQVLRSNDSG